jgi:hypothetical protein
MEKRSTDSVTANAGRASATGVTGSSPAPSPVSLPSENPSSNSLPFILAGVGLLAVIGLIAVVWSQASSTADHTDPTKPRVSQDKWRVETDDDRVCDQFMKRRAEGDVAANALLGRVPAVPEKPFSSPEELERMQCDFYLHDPNTRVLAISREPVVGGPLRYRFKTEGNIAPPRLPIQRPTEVEHWGRTMYNLQLIVEVNDGKLFGVSGKNDLPR